MRTSLRGFTILLATVLGFALMPPVVGADADIPLHVTVDGATISITDGTTLGDALAIAGRLPPRGNLVSVTGRVLRAGAVSGLVLLDGEPAVSDVVLHDGAVVTFKPGPNVREPVERTLAPSTATGNPIRTLPLAYGARVTVVRGTISKEVVREGAAPGRGVRPAVALTFDDGPDPQWTIPILRVLRKYRVPATFFATGRNVERYPHIVRALRAVGMSVQNHSWNHENLGRMGPGAVRANLIAQIRALRKQGMPFPKWFRPPYGVYDVTTVRIASALGMRTAIWSADPSDYRRPPAGMLARRVLAQTKPGGVILLHDGGGNRANTLAALPTIIETLLARGYRFVALA